jgi:hypothetical protein
MIIQTLYGEETYQTSTHMVCQVQWRTEGCLVGSNSRRNYEVLKKTEPNSQFRGKYIPNNLIRIRGTLICKLI